MEKVMDVAVLRRVMVALFLATLAFSLLYAVKGRGRGAAYGSLSVGILVTLVAGWLSWNGHDWIPDDDGPMRALAAVIGCAAIAVMRLSPSPLNEPEAIGVLTKDR
jgi:hypothetical protein